jgi:hypothetical protein
MMSEALRKAAKQAIEMLGHCTPDKRYGDDYLEREFAELNAVRKALRAALAEPEQEPVFWTGKAWIDEAKRGRNGTFVNQPFVGFDVPLYTAPPRREPLTDEQIYAVVRSKQPYLEDTSVAWKQQFAECKYWLLAAHYITGEKT